MSPRRRTGKVAKLPRELRWRVNEMLQDGADYSDISKMLKKEGHSISAQNLSNWKSGGFLDWKREQQRLEDLKLKRDFALDIVNSGAAGDLQEASIHVATSHIYELLTEFDTKELKDLVKTEPENYSKIVNALSRLSKAGLDYRNYRDKVAEKKRAIEAELDKSKKGKGLTEESLEVIRRELQLL